MELYFFDLEEGRKIRYSRNGRVVVEDELINKFTDLKRAVEEEDCNKIIEILSEDKRNKRFVSYFKRVKRDKVKRKYIAEVRSLIERIEEAYGVEIYVRIRYDTAKDKMYLLVVADKLSGVWKEYDISLRTFFKIIEGRQVYIDYEGSTFEARFTKRFKNKHYLEHEENVDEWWFDNVFKGKAGKYYNFFGWVSSRGNEREYIHVIEEVVNPKEGKA